MTEIAAIPGKAVVDRQVLIQLLAMLTPSELDETSTVYHIGYERAKADAMAILGRSLGPELSTPVATRLIKELRRDKGA